MKTVRVAVTNDLATDQRVRRHCEVLHGLGFRVVLIGRHLQTSPPVDRPYETVRFRLPFTKGALFYAAYNLRLFAHLLFHKTDIVLCNDLDTLLPGFLVSRIKRIPLVYDTHEYFLGVPEIQGRWVKNVWAAIERSIFPKLSHVFTVNASIAELYYRDYGIRPLVIRNIADTRREIRPANRKELGLPEDAFLLINQGTGINVDRGMEELLEALPLLPDVHLVLVGSGDVLEELKRLAKEKSLTERIHFIPRQTYAKMLQYTAAADAGVSLDKDTNINYRFSLPNKLFDYIHCGIPVICSGVVEVRRIVEFYGIGEVITSHQPKDLADAISRLRQKGTNAYVSGLERAAAELTWEKEKRPLEEVFGSLL